MLFKYAKLKCVTHYSLKQCVIIILMNPTRHLLVCLQNAISQTRLVLNIVKDVCNNLYTVMFEFNKLYYSK